MPSPSRIDCPSLRHRHLGNVALTGDSYLSRVDLLAGEGIVVSTHFDWSTPTLLVVDSNTQVVDGQKLVSLVELAVIFAIVLVGAS